MGPNNTLGGTIRQGRLVQKMVEQMVESKWYPYCQSNKAVGKAVS